jgi:sphingolipid delta-4 desaturase
MGHLGIHYWWASLIVAYLFGAFANHCIYVTIHDAAHNLIFRNRTLNKIFAIVADLPNVFPGETGFSIYHLKHHAHQGQLDLDADMPSHWEARLVKNRWYGKMIWLQCFALVEAARPMRIHSVRMCDKWFAMNCIAAILFDAAIVFFCGWNGLLYLLASMLFAVGLHPLGGRWISEHFTLSPAQETMSYYGPLNIVGLNIGYHNEHHDFPSIPWNRLPRLRALAPEFYDNLKFHKSWTMVALRFIFDPRYSLYCRVERNKSLPQIDPARS